MNKERAYRTDRQVDKRLLFNIPIKKKLKFLIYFISLFKNYNISTIYFFKTPNKNRKK